MKSPYPELSDQLLDTNDDKEIRRFKRQLNTTQRIMANLIVVGICVALCLALGTFCILIYAKMIESKLATIQWNLLQKTLDMEKDIILQEIEETLKTVERENQCGVVPSQMRFDCHPEDGASEATCTARGCCWDPSIRRSPNKTGRVPLNVPYCYYSQDWQLYKYTSISPDSGGITAKLKNVAPSFYKNDLPNISMLVRKTQSNVLRVKIYDSDKKRYEPLWPALRDLYNDPGKSLYQFELDENKPGFRVLRASNNVTIFDSITPGGFIFADQFLQISTLLPSHNIYGLGEHRSSLKLNTNWTSFTLFNKDQPPVENANLYGSHPFYMVIEESGDCHGVLLLNSNAMDVILQPTPGLTFRSIGGVFDMFFFMGPTPHEVLQQYALLTGSLALPPYWSLGFHLCRFGYRTLEGTREVWNRTRAAGIPFDVQWNDLDYMENNNGFTYDKDKFKDLPKFVEELHSIGMHYVPLFDPGVSASEANGTYPPYDEGIRLDIFIKDAETNGPFIGKVWNRVSTVWPDFTRSNIGDYWYNMMNNLHQQFQYDGAWIDMNEISNFYDGHKNGCTNNPLDNPPYVPNIVGNVLAAKTLCMNAQHAQGPHYNIHNTYGTGEAAATHDALIKIRQKRPFIVSRATWVGHGRYAAHWTGDVFSTWHDLRMSIPEILQFSLFHIPMVGADICGFNGNTTAELCSRWMQVGAFYPFARNHNSDDTIEQDPVALGDLVVKSSKNALTIRYRLLPFLYTLFWEAVHGPSTVARPLFFDFWRDRNTLDIDSQFMWGDKLMIVPVLEQGKTNVKGYLPEGVWYDYYNKTGIKSTGEWFTFDAPVNRIPLFVRGGSIIPAQVPGQTTTESRRNKFEMIVAIDENSAKTSGSLFWDDGDSLEMTKPWLYQLFDVTNGCQLTNTRGNKNPRLDDKMMLGTVEVMGVLNDVTNVTANGTVIKTFSYDKLKRYLVISNLEIDLTQDFVITW